MTLEGKDAATVEAATEQLVASLPPGVVVRIE